MHPQLHYPFCLQCRHPDYMALDLKRLVYLVMWHVIE